MQGHPCIDRRGSFLNLFRADESAFVRSWGARGIGQVNLSSSQTVGTVRGLHLQAAPHSEAKLVRCLKGKVWDVAVDLRRGSATYGKWQAIELSPERCNALLIPEAAPMAFRYWKQAVSYFICIPDPGCRRRKRACAMTIPS
nr:dTDP-4-dehydrorhamnose 3,5-epimerase family protein [Synechococcus sp. GFB01]